MTLQEARIIILKELNLLYDKSEAHNISDLILEKVSRYERSDQIRHSDLSLTPEQAEEIEKILLRLKQNEPVQYVLEEAWFAGMKFKVNKHVLIPRPETEELVEWLVKEASGPELPAISILDVGTGSGCIAIAIKKKLPLSKVHAIDISNEALSLARENSIALGTDIELICLDFLNEEKWKELGMYEMIVSNPPYVLQKEKETMHKRVASYEPTLALFVPDEDGLIFYRELAEFSLQHLKADGNIFVEINESCGKEVVNLFQSKGFHSVELRKDMQGKDRMVRGVKSYES